MDAAEVESDQPPASGSTPALSAPNAEAMEWPTTSESYELLSKIGRGAFATVWKATPKSTENFCAVKILNLDQVDSNLQEIRREVQAMRLSRHDNILACYAAFLQDQYLWLVTTLMRKGSSLHCLQAARRRRRRERSSVSMEPHIFYILQQSLLGLDYIHNTQQAIHRDVKGGNILVDSDGSVKLADFGVAQFLNQGGTAAQQRARTFVGTPCWMAPEVMEQHSSGYDTKADIWSLGITALELAKGHAPYAKYPPMKVLILTIQEDPPSLDTYKILESDADDDDDEHDAGEDFSKIFVSLVDQCLQKNAGRRPTSAQLLQHRALQQMTNDAQHLKQRQESLRELICDHVPDVGSNSDPDHHRKRSNNKSHEQVKIVMQGAGGEERQKGTTWVFADGSQILSSTALTTGEAMSVTDAMDELEDFGKVTGGEHYQQQDQPPPAAAAKEDAGAVDEEDMDAFMCTLEQVLPGEDYQPRANDDPNEQ